MTERIAVLAAPRAGLVRAIADAIADALDAGIVPSAPSDGPRIALAEDDAVVSVDPAAAEIVVAIDPASLARAVELESPVRIAWVGWLDREWESVLPGAHAVLVAHPALVDAVVAMGVSRARVRIASFVAPRGASIDRDAARAELGLGASEPILVVPFAALGDDLTALLVQLSLARDGIRVLFDVGRDLEAARALRRRATFRAHMFAEGPLADRAWAAADRALVRLEGPELARAIAFGVAPILAPPRVVDASAARALASAGLATIATSDVTLAIAIDEACSLGGIERARAAITGLDVRSGAERTASAVRAVIDDLRASARPGGLPDGLEAIGPDDEKGSRDHGPSASPPPSPDDEIERELSALREKIRSGRADS